MIIENSYLFGFLSMSAKNIPSDIIVTGNSKNRILGKVNIKINDIQPTINSFMVVSV